MRVYVTVTVAQAREILAHGFCDAITLHGRGVIVRETPADPDDGDVVLVVEVPGVVIVRYQLLELRGNETWRTGEAVIPAATLNQHKPVQIYDHFYYGCSRRELVQAATKWEADAEELEHSKAFEAEQ